MFDKNDFYSWAFSNLNANNLRGIVAEYIVHRLLACKNEKRVEWDACDLVGPDDRLIEVKSTGYIQTWPQHKESRLVFDIAKKISWFSGTNTTSKEKIRAADIYIFCLFSEQDKARINPLDPAQWEFIVSTRMNLEKSFGEQKSVCWNRLCTLVSDSVSSDKLLSKYLAT